jgi:hypothetical protein
VARVRGGISRLTQSKRIIARSNNMAGKKSLICMAFDGDYVTEGLAKFDTISDAWQHANDMGSKWFFYPFCFVTGESNAFVIDAPIGLGHLAGRSVKYVVKHFEYISKLPESKDANVERFVFLSWLHSEEI